MTPVDVALVKETEILLTQCGISPGSIAPNFITYWLSHGKTPQEIRRIALGPRCPDAHLGGLDA